jgi:hypothetical protein
MPEVNFIEEDPVTYSSGDAAVLVTATAVVQYPNDLDQTPIAQATATVTQGFSPGDVLSFTGNNPNLVAEYADEEGLLTLTGEGTLDEYTQAIREIAFSSTEAKACLAREITFVVQDADGFLSTDTEHRSTASPYVPAARTIAVCSTIVDVETGSPTLLPTAAPTQCTEYCCEHQLVIWAVPLSAGQKCKHGSTTTDTTFEDCQNSCVSSSSCGYFAFDEVNGCQQSDFSAKCDMKTRLVDDADTGYEQGLYMLFCSVQGSTDKTCSGKKLPDSGISPHHADRTLTNCYDRCFRDEEKDSDCTYFSYHEHTQECELFPHCDDGFVDTEATAQSLVFMMHEEAWGKSSEVLADMPSDSFERALSGHGSFGEAVCAEYCKTSSPTLAPTALPTVKPSMTPTEKPSLQPTMKPSNVSPALGSMEPAVLKYVSGDDPVDVSERTTVKDLNTEEQFGGDPTPLRSATVTISKGFAQGDKLIVPGTSKFEISYDEDVGEMSVEGEGSPEEYEELFHKVQFEGAEAAEETSREVTFVVMDDGLESNRVVRVIAVCASVCDTYCCEHQLVIWAVPLSAGALYTIGHRPCTIDHAP